MPQTTNYGFPLWADTPPEGATGKDLRDAILGPGADSLASKVDTALKGIADAIPTKVSDLENDAGFTDGQDLTAKENLSNKVGAYDFVDGGWMDSAEKYPSVNAVRGFVASYVGTHAVTPDAFQEAYYGLIEPAVGAVPLDAAAWNGETEGKANLLGLCYKISDSTEQPDTFRVELSLRDTSSGEVTALVPTALGLPYVYSNHKNTALKEAFGIVGYYWVQDDGSSQPLVMVADRAGALPAAVVEQMTGINPGVSVPYEAGTYVLYQGAGSGYAQFVSKATPYVGVKSYIDRRIAEALATMGGNAE